MDEYLEGIPSEQQFRKDILDIFPDGDLSAAHNQLITVLESGMIDNDGKPLTWSYILTKFRKLHEKWLYDFGSKDQKYLKDRDREKRLDIYDFIVKQYWTREFEIRKNSPERDKYLFGSLPIDNLHSQLTRFREAQERK